MQVSPRLGAAEGSVEPAESAQDEILREALVLDAFTSTKLELTLSPTEKCNFRCVYCYEYSSIGRMRPAVVSGVRNLILRRAAGRKTLQISWFGGEPLLAYDIVTEIGEFAARVAVGTRRHADLGDDHERRPAQRGTVPPPDGHGHPGVPDFPRRRPGRA
jgi:hypothetical protein